MMHPLSWSDTTFFLYWMPLSFMGGSWPSILAEARPRSVGTLCSIGPWAVPPRGTLRFWMGALGLAARPGLGPGRGGVVETSEDVSVSLANFLSPSFFSPPFLASH
jgi:hypothetical protein